MRRIRAFETTRNQYVASFINAITEFPQNRIEIEPLSQERSSSGADGWGFGKRDDFVYIFENGTRSRHVVNVGRSYDFEPFVDPLGIGISKVLISPFAWNAVHFEITGVADERFWDDVADWVRYRIQPSSGSEPLNGCLHSIRIADETRTGKQLFCDLGSLSVFGFDELIGLCGSWGVNSVSIS